MLEEVYEIQKISGERVSNLVLMGTGEQLDNYDNVRKFIELLTDENGLHISQRNVTLSTCGIVPNIRRAGRRGASDHAGALSSRVEPGEKGKTYAYCEAV